MKEKVPSALSCRQDFHQKSKLCFMHNTVACKKRIKEGFQDKENKAKPGKKEQANKIMHAFLAN